MADRIDACMAAIQPHRPVLLILAAFSRYAEALDWARQTAEDAWGPVALQSERFDHRETNYYEATMGPDLKKTFFAFESLRRSGRSGRVQRDDATSGNSTTSSSADIPSRGR